MEQEPAPYWQLTDSHGEEVVTNFFTNGADETKEETTFPDGGRQTTIYRDGALVETVLSFADGRVTTVFGNGGLRIADPNTGTLVDLPTAEAVANWHAQIGSGESLLRSPDEVVGNAFDEIAAEFDAPDSGQSHDPGSDQR